MSAPLRHVEGVVAQEAHGRTVLLRMGDGAYFTLDDTGGEVWRNCDGVRDLDAVIAQVCDVFDAPPDVIAADVREFVAEMRAENLLEEG